LEWKVDPVADLVTTAGDTLYATAADTLARLAIGTAGQVLQVNSGATAPEWATPAGGSPTFVGCSVYDGGAGQSIPNATYTIRNFNTELYDTDGFHDNSVNNSRITIPSGKSGYYLVRFNQPLLTSTTGDRNYYINKNGSLIGQHAGTPSAVYPIHEGGRVIYLAAGDYIQLDVYQASGGALNYGTTSTGGYFSVAFLGA
jgi:hypothetical protein